VRPPPSEAWPIVNGSIRTIIVDVTAGPDDPRPTDTCPAAKLEYAGRPARVSRLATCSLALAILSSPLVAGPLLIWSMTPGLHPPVTVDLHVAVPILVVWPPVFALAAIARVRMSRGECTGARRAGAALLVSLSWWVLFLVMILSFRH
jgi:hypothetical protein